MGSASTQALAASVTALDAASVDLTTARELFAAARIVGESSQLSGALADPAAPGAARAKVVSDVFGAGLSATSVQLLSTVVGQRWSSASELVDGIEDLAIRAAARSAEQTDIEGELFQVSRTVAANPELELALGGRLGDAQKKGELIASILRGKASDATVLIVSSLVQQPRERRVRQLLSGAMRTVAQQRGRTVATVVSATALTDAQAERLKAVLKVKYGRDVALNTVVDPKVVGGLRVQVADDVIDASIASRLADLRQRLAG